MERVEVPPRVDLDRVREMCKQRREAEMTGVWLPIEDVESMLIEVILYRTKFDAASRRQKDGVRGRKPVVPKITLENVDQYDESPGA
jgi:hypothetical protein